MPQVQPIAERVAQNLEIMTQLFQRTSILPMGFTISTTWQYITDDKSHENPGTPGTELKVLRDDLKIMCHPICNQLYTFSKVVSHAAQVHILKSQLQGGKDS